MVFEVALSISTLVFSPMGRFNMHLTSERTVIGAEFPNAAIPFPASLISGRVADHHTLLNTSTFHSALGYWHHQIAVDLFSAKHQ
jgi:hypothetical protein